MHNQLLFLAQARDGVSKDQASGPYPEIQAEDSVGETSEMQPAGTMATFSGPTMKDGESPIACTQEVAWPWGPKGQTTASTCLAATPTLSRIDNTNSMVSQLVEVMQTNQATSGQLALWAEFIKAFVSGIAPLANSGPSGQQSTAAQGHGSGEGGAGASNVLIKDLLVPSLPWGVSCGDPTPGTLAM